MDREVKCDFCEYTTHRLRDLMRHRLRKRPCSEAAAAHRRKLLLPNEDESPVAFETIAEGTAGVVGAGSDEDAGGEPSIGRSGGAVPESFGSSTESIADLTEGVGHNCSSCYRVFETLEGLNKHTKNGCDRRPSPYGCPKCGKDCQTSQRLYKHRRSCVRDMSVAQPQPTDPNGGAEPATLEALRDEIRQLRQQIQGTATVTMEHGSNGNGGGTPIQIHSNTTNNTHNTTNNNNIQILNFDLRNGTEYDTSHMTPEKVRDILHRFRPCHLPQAGNHLLQLLYSNPVNRNIRKGSLYHKLCEVFMDDEWRSMPESNVIRTLTYDLFSAALEHYEQLKTASKNHAAVLNDIISDREPYEPAAREVVRAALFDVTRKYPTLVTPQATGRSSAEDAPKEP